MKYILAFSLLFVATLTQAQAPAVPQASVVFSSLSQMTAYTGSLTQAIWTDPQRGGPVNLVDATGLTVDNGIVFTSAKAGKLWKRDLSQTNAIDVKWFGMVDDSVTDNSTNFQQANLAATALHKSLIAHKGNKPYYLASAITLTTSLISPDSAAFVGRSVVFQTGSRNITIDGVTIIGQSAMTPTQALAAGLDTVTNFTALAAYSRGVKTSVLVTDTLHGGLMTWLSSGTPNGTTRIAALGGGIWSTAVSDFAIRIIHDGAVVQRCSIINARVMAWKSDVLDSLRNIKIINNSFNVDFSYIEHSVNQNDAIAFRGVQDAVFSGNRVLARNIHRVLKLQDNPLSVSLDTVSKFTTSNVSILTNKIYATTNSNKQVMDLFLEALNVEIANNHIEAYGFTDGIENKTGIRCIYPVNTSIHDNQIKTDANLIFNFQGSLGATEKYWNGTDSISYEAGFQNIDIHDNKITYTGTDETNDAISIRFYHYVSINGNTFHNPNNLGAWKAIEVLSNGVADINNNIIDTGIISASTATTNSNGKSFIPKFSSLNIGGNTIKRYWGGSGYGGIMITGIHSPTGIINVHDNNIMKDTIDAFQRNSIYIKNNNVLARTLTGNTTYAKNDLESDVLISTDTAVKAINMANSWNYLSQLLNQNGNSYGNSINVGSSDIHDVNLQISAGRKEINVDTSGNILINEFSGDEPGWPARKKLEIRGSSNGAGILDSSIIGLQLTNQSSLGSQVGITAAHFDSRLKNYRYGGLYWRVTGSSPSGAIGDAIIGYKVNLADTTLTGGTWFKSTGQVSINDSTPNAAAIFNITSINKGVLFTRMSRSQFGSIASKPHGLFSFGTTLGKFIYYDSVNSLTRVLLDSTTADALYQQKITLTTTGTSGAATFSSNTLNIPQYASGAHIFATVSSNQTTTSTTLADVTGMSFAVAANKKYSFRIDLLTACDNTGGMKLKFTGPSTTTAAISFAGNSTGIATGQFNSYKDLVTAIITGYNRFVGDGGVSITGHFTTTNSGTLQLQFAASTAGQTITIYAGSMGDIVEVVSPE